MNTSWYGSWHWIVLETLHLLEMLYSIISEMTNYLVKESKARFLQV